MSYGRGTREIKKTQPSTAVFCEDWRYRGKALKGCSAERSKGWNLFGYASTTGLSQKSSTVGMKNLRKIEGMVDSFLLCFCRRGLLKKVSNCSRGWNQWQVAGAKGWGGVVTRTGDFSQSNNGAKTGSCRAKHCYHTLPLNTHCQLDLMIRHGDPCRSS